MAINDPLRKSILLTISWLYTVLYVYAAISKLLDFESFGVQLGQSPLVGSFAAILSYAVPALEIILAIALSVARSRMLALYGSYALMCLFTAYIVIMLHYSPFVPCSCGGILESMGWDAHLLFNVTFTFLGGLAIIIGDQKVLKDRYTGRYTIRRLGALVGILVLSALFIYLLHLQSERTFHHNNPFIRRFIPGTCVKDKEMKLPNNYYYFAGSSEGKIYLGNHKAPLYILEVDTLLNQTREYRIHLPSYDYPFRNVQVQVRAPYFFVMDGSVPVIFKGRIMDWEAAALEGNYSFFSRAEAVDSSHIVYRGQDAVTKDNQFGYFDVSGRDISWHMGQTQPERQIDGFFDTDGLLFSDLRKNTFLYLYFYRNGYLCTSPTLQLLSKSHTIDTITHAQVKVAFLKGGLERRLSAPALVVNKHACAGGGRLLVHSAIMGKFETKEMWQSASIVDVYNYQLQKYISSAYIYHEGSLSISEMMVEGDNLYVILGYHLHRYKLGGELIEKRQ
jgi:hypothetical protein